MYKLDAFHIRDLILIKICPKAICNSFEVTGVLSSWDGEHLQLILSKPVPMETVFRLLLPRPSSDCPELGFNLAGEQVCVWKGAFLWGRTGSGTQEAHNPYKVSDLVEQPVLLGMLSSAPSHPDL